MIAIEFLGHATVIVNVDGCRVIFDPHLLDDYRLGLFGYNPPRKIDLATVLDEVSAIVLSHSHRDHFDIPSLKLFDRDIPVFIPHDYRIQHAISMLGFTEAFVISDWAQFRLASNLSITVTPSAYRVPEHGFLMQSNGISVWNMVDSHVNEEWCEQVNDMIHGSLDYVLIPAQPLIEGNATSAVAPYARKHRVDEVVQAVRTLRPSYVIPFADGHLCLNRTRWLNRHWMPFTDQDKWKTLSEAEVGCQILDIDAGNSLVIEKASGALMHRVSDSKYVKSVEARCRPRFEPGYSMDPAASGIPASNEDLNMRIDMLFDKAVLIRVADKLNAFNLVSVPAKYRFIVLDEYSEPILIKSLYWNGSAFGPNNSFRLPVIEVVIGASELVNAFDSTMEFSAVLIGGLVRESLFNVDDVQQFVFRSVADIVDPELTQPLFFSGIFLLNQLLLLEKDRAVDEVESLLETKQTQSVGSTKSNSVWSARTEFQYEGNHFDQYIHSAISENILKSIRYDQWSRVYRFGELDLFIGFPDFGVWDIPSGIAKVAVPVNLIGPQSVFGCGVGYARRLAHSLATNLEAFSIDEISLGVLNGKSIPNWRLHDILPLQAARLGAELGDRLQLDCPWWLGYPPPDCENSHLTYTIRLDLGLTQPIQGVVNAAFMPTSINPTDLAFILRTSNGNVFDQLLNGNIRLSWLFPESKWSAYGIRNWHHVTNLACKIVSHFLGTKIAQSGHDCDVGELRLDDLQIDKSSS